MEYRLKQGEGVPEGVRRMAAAQLDRALGYLGCQDGERDKHIHEARKATKRLRALVALGPPRLRRRGVRLGKPVLSERRAADFRAA